MALTSPAALAAADMPTHVTVSGVDMYGTDISAPFPIPIIGWEGVFVPGAPGTFPFTPVFDREIFGHSFTFYSAYTLPTFTVHVSAFLYADDITDSHEVYFGTTGAELVGRYLTPTVEVRVFDGTDYVLQALAVEWYPDPADMNPYVAAMHTFTGTFPAPPHIQDTITRNITIRPHDFRLYEILYDWENADPMRPYGTAEADLGLPPTVPALLYILGGIDGDRRLTSADMLPGGHTGGYFPATLPITWQSDPAFPTQGRPDELPAGFTFTPALALENTEHYLLYIAYGADAMPDHEIVLQPIPLYDYDLPANVAVQNINYGAPFSAINLPRYVQARIRILNNPALLLQYDTVYADAGNGFVYVYRYFYVAWTRPTILQNLADTDRLDNTVVNPVLGASFTFTAELLRERSYPYRQRGDMYYMPTPVTPTIVVGIERIPLVGYTLPQNVEEQELSYGALFGDIYLPAHVQARIRIVNNTILPQDVPLLYPEDLAAPPPYGFQYVLRWLEVEWDVEEDPTHPLYGFGDNDRLQHPIVAGAEFTFTATFVQERYAPYRDVPDVYVGAVFPTITVRILPLHLTGYYLDNDIAAQEVNYGALFTRVVLPEYVQARVRVVQNTVLSSDEVLAYTAPVGYVYVLRYFAVNWSNPTTPRDGRLQAPAINPETGTVYHFYATFVSERHGHTRPIGQIYYMPAPISPRIVLTVTRREYVIQWFIELPYAQRYQIGPIAAHRDHAYWVARHGSDYGRAVAYGEIMQALLPTAIVPGTTHNRLPTTATARVHWYDGDSLVDYADIPIPASWGTGVRREDAWDEIPGFPFNVTVWFSGRPGIFDFAPAPNFALPTHITRAPHLTTPVPHQSSYQYYYDGNYYTNYYYYFTYELPVGAPAYARFIPCTITIQRMRNNFNGGLPFNVLHVSQVATGTMSLHYAMRTEMHRRFMYQEEVHELRVSGSPTITTTPIGGLRPFNSARWASRTDDDHRTPTMSPYWHMLRTMDFYQFYGTFAAEAIRTADLIETVILRPQSALTGNYVFANNTSLRTVATTRNIPPQMRYYIDLHDIVGLPRGAFLGGTSIEAIRMAYHIATYPAYAFFGAANLRLIVLSRAGVGTSGAASTFQGIPAGRVMIIRDDGSLGDFHVQEFAGAHRIGGFGAGLYAHLPNRFGYVGESVTLSPLPGLTPEMIARMGLSFYWYMGTLDPTATRSGRIVNSGYITYPATTTKPPAPVLREAE
jgi:hypothetical protein